MSRKITVKCFCASDVICNCNAIKNPPSAIRQTAEGIYSVCRKSLFFQKVLVLNPYPQTPFPGKGAILLGLPPLDPVGGYAPATPFLYNQEVYRQSEAPSLFAREPDCISLTSGEILLVKSEDCNNCTVVLFIDEVLYIV